MPPSDQRPSPLFIPRVLWAAILASTWIYGLVAVLVTQGGAPTSMTPRPAPAVMLEILGACGLVLLIAAPIVQARMLPRRERVSDAAPIDLAERMARPAGRAVMAKVFVAWLISWAMCEAVAIFGLVAVMLRGAPLEYVPFAVAADLGLIVLGPRAAVLEQIARAMPDEPPR